MRTVFVDLDNTLALNETCDDIPYTRGLYLNKKPIKEIINLVDYYYRDIANIIIISRYVGGEDGKQEKIDWMRKYLPKSFLINSPYLITSDDIKTKADYINEYSISNNMKLEDCTIIDDKKEILQQCKKIGIEALYPQQLIVRYEEELIND
ncbi:MAG: hypothetical protein IJH63_11995 [Methanobrevibacter sp.]|nr:hypothetical protein [Methanobrevibacter sp.]